MTSLLNWQNFLNLAKLPDATACLQAGNPQHALVRVTGKDAEATLGRANITCNKNGVPFDPEKPTVTSGIRLGSPAGTTRGFGEAEFRQIADWIIEVVDGLAANGEDGNAAVEAKVRAEVEALCARFPIYPNL